jgi:hypothetical protein
MRHQQSNAIGIPVRDNERQRATNSERDKQRPTSKPAQTPWTTNVRQ